jgi:hypothetical protein
MKLYPILFLALIACVSRPTETETTTDSLTQVSDTVAVSEAVVTAAAETPLPDSIKNHPLAGYHGEYRLQSSSSAEQARMTIRFEGNNRFTYSINYNVADFCSDDASGSFVVDENRIGKDPANAANADQRAPGSGYIAFTLGNGMINVVDGINEFGVGKCNLSGDFYKCDGPCPAIKSEDYGIEDAEGDTVN